MKTSKSIAFFMTVLICMGMTLVVHAQSSRYRSSRNTSNNQATSGNTASPLHGQNQDTLGNTGLNSQTNLNSSRNRSSLRSRASSRYPTTGQGVTSSRNYSQQPNGLNNQNSQAIQPGQQAPSLSPGLINKPNGTRPGSSTRPRYQPKSPSTNRIITGGSQQSRNYSHITIPDMKTRPTTTLYLQCPKSIAIINKPIQVFVELANYKKMEFDRLAFVLDYNPDDLLLTSGQDASGQWKKSTSLSVTPSKSQGHASIKQDANSTLLCQDRSKFRISANIVDPEKGLIYFDMNSIGGPSNAEGKVVQLTFVPLRESHSKISFLFINPEKRDPATEPLTRLTLAEKDQLGSSLSQADGVVNLELDIYESEEKARRYPGITKSNPIDEETIAREHWASLSLVPKQEQWNVGDTVDVDVVLSNPSKQVFDAVNLLIAFNPRIFEPVDGDESTPGINVLDEPYRHKFPLDFTLHNEIDAKKGIVDYRKKSMRRPIRNEGVLATLRLRAIRPTTKTTFRIFISATGQEPTTSVTYKFQDRLGNGKDPFDGVKTCSLHVRPTTVFLEKFKSR